jgi:hypothetical protein
MIRLSLDVLEDLLPKDLMEDYDLTRADVPETLITFWKSALARLEGHPALNSPSLNPLLVKKGYGTDPITCQVLLCSRSSMENLFENEHVLGAHLIDTPDCDPLNDESAFAREYRVAMVADRAEFLENMSRLAERDFMPANHQLEYLAAYLNTMFHEIAHAILFAENAALISPSDVDLLQDAGEIEYGITECSTGYGIRPLKIDGADLYAKSEEEAEDLMEQYVENLGRDLMYFALTDDQDIAHFPKAFGVKEDFQQAMLDHA